MGGISCGQTCLTLLVGNLLVKDVSGGSACGAPCKLWTCGFELSRMEVSVREGEG